MLNRMRWPSVPVLIVLAGCAAPKPEAANAANVNNADAAHTEHAAPTYIERSRERLKRDEEERQAEERRRAFVNRGAGGP
jgi:hypothetical protein